MAKNVRANIELGINIVIAVAVVAVSAVVVKRHLFDQPVNNNAPLQQQEQAMAGTRITVPNVDWEQNQKSLVFFLKKDCVYCKMSAPFYRQLIEEASKRDVKWLAILPESVEEGTKYVRSLELPIDNVQSGSLPSYKVTATPTVVFVDHAGVVKSAWIGAAPNREKEIKEKLLALF